MEYLIKYDTSGQFQWFRTPASYTGFSSPPPSLSITPSGEVFWFSLLEPGSYNGGSFFINTRRYYAVHYNASGSYQDITQLDMSPPTPGIISSLVFFYFDPATNRFYTFLTHQPTYGTLAIGTTTIVPPVTALPRTAVLAAFNRQGMNLWVQQGGTAKNTYAGSLTFGEDGTLFLTGRGDVGSIFCGDTATNSLAPGTPNTTFHIMALDTNANKLWSTYIRYSVGALSSNISVRNNTIAATGCYGDTLSCGNDTITNSSLHFKGYLLRLNAATGAVLQLDAIHSSSNQHHYTFTTALDKNENVYITGHSPGTVYFANDSLSPYAFGNNGRLYQSLLKYKNVNCHCDLLQPAFNVTGGGATYQFTYTGQTPYTALNWDFSDGSPTVSGASPSHTYTLGGEIPCLYYRYQ